MKYLIVKTYADLAHIQLTQEAGFLKNLVPVTTLEEIPAGTPEENISSANEGVSKTNFCRDIKDCLQFLKYPIHTVDPKDLNVRVLSLLIEGTDEMSEVNVEEINIDDEYNRVLGFN